MRSLLFVYILALCGHDKDAGQQGSANLSHLRRVLVNSVYIVDPCQTSAFKPAAAQTVRPPQHSLQAAAATVMVLYVTSLTCE